MKYQGHWRFLLKIKRAMWSVGVCVLYWYSLQTRVDQSLNALGSGVHLGYFSGDRSMSFQIVEVDFALLSG